MKKTIAFLTTAVLLVSSICGCLVVSASGDQYVVPAPATNVVVNGSFETMEGWSYINGVSTQVSDGNYSNYIVPSPQMQLFQTVQVEPNTTYLLSADVYFESIADADAAVGIDLNFYNQDMQGAYDNSHLSYHWLAIPASDGTPVGQWVNQSKLWYSGSRTEVQLRIDIIKCNAYIDNVKLIKQAAVNGCFENVNTRWEAMSFDYDGSFYYEEYPLLHVFGDGYSARAAGAGMKYGVQPISVKPNTFYYLSAKFYRPDANKTLHVWLYDIGRDDMLVTSQSTGAWEEQSLVWYSGSYSGNATLKLVANDTDPAAPATGNYYIDDIHMYEIAQPIAPAGKVFSGLYMDAEGTNPFVPAEQNERVYPKWTDANVLTVKTQLSKGATAESASTDLRLVSTVDSLQYAEVGYYIQVGEGVEKKYSSNTVYNRISGADESYVPTVFSEESEHFFVFTIRNIPQANFGTAIKVTPYWVTLEGTTVYGAARTVNVSGLLG